MGEPKKKNKKLSFNDLKLEQIVFEAQFPFAWLYSDYAGSLWKEIEDKLPKKRFLINSFDHTGGVCTYGDKFEIAIANERLFVAGFYPETSLNDYLEVFRTIFEIVTDKLQIEIFNRIGVRLNFVKKFDSMEKANESISTIPHLNIPTKIYSDLEKEKIAPSFTIRVEDEMKGRLYMIRSAMRTFSLELPMYYVAEKNQPINQGFHESIVSFDVDNYTRIPVSVGQISPNDWVTQIYKSVKKDSLKFFE